MEEDGEPGTSGSGWSPPPMNQGGPGSPTTEEDIRSTLAAANDTFENWRQNPWPRKEEFWFKLGYLDIEVLLNPLIDAGEWTEASKYLVRTFRFHRTKAKQAGAAVLDKDRRIWDMRWSHPELYMLPRVQGALQHASQGLVAIARERHDHLRRVADWAAQHNGQDYGDFLLEMLGFLGRVVSRGLQVSPQQLVQERERAKLAIRDYLYVYLPEPSGRLSQVPEGTNRPLWLLVDRVPDERRFRCLLCHKVLTGDTWNVRRHLALCKAATPSIKARLTDPKDGDDKGKGPEGDPGAGPSGGGGGVPPGAGGAGAAAAIVGAA